MSNIKVHVHQVGFVPIYIPFYIAMEKLSQKLGWDIVYHVGTSDEEDIKRACRCKYEDRDNIHLVLTALHNLHLVSPSANQFQNLGIAPSTSRQGATHLPEVCKDCQHLKRDICDGINEDVRWYFPWIFIIKLPVYVFLKGGIENCSELHKKIKELSVRIQFTWDDIKKLIQDACIKKIYIYPKGATLNDAVLNHILRNLKDKLEVETINFDIERQDKEEKIDKEKDSVLVFTLNPHLYEEDNNYTLLMKPSNHFFPFTGIAIPVIKERGVTTNDMKLLYHLEEEYVNFMTTLQEVYSPFFEKRKDRANRLEEYKAILLKHLEGREYFSYKKGQYNCNSKNTRTLSKEKLQTFWSNFEKLYIDGVFREHEENIVVDYLEEKISEKISLFDKNIYEARVKDSVAYIFARNLSHIYGSNVIPYAVKLLQEVEHELKSAKENSNLIGKSLIGKAKKTVEFSKDFLGFLQERMDYLSSVVSDEYISTYAFMPIPIDTLESIVSGNRYKSYEYGNIYNFLAYLYKSVNKSLKITTEIEKLVSKDNLLVAVPPVGYEQALYSIFENILRNAAKYGKPHGNTLKFKVIIEDLEGSDLIKISIIDTNVPPEEEKIDNLIESLKIKLNKATVKPYLDIYYENWGLKEMKISASYIRGIPLSKLDILDEDLIRIEKKDVSFSSRISQETDKEAKKIKGVSFEFYVYKYKNLQKVSWRDILEGFKSGVGEFLIVSGAECDKLRKWAKVFYEDELESLRLKNLSDDELIKNLQEIWLKSLSGDNNIDPWLLPDQDKEKIKEFLEIPDKSFENKIIIAYIRHLEDIIKPSSDEINRIEKIKEKYPYSYIHPLKGGSPIQVIVKDIVEKSYDFLRYKLLESALLRVLIIDERVQSLVKDLNYNIKYYNVFAPETPLSGKSSAITHENVFDNLKTELTDIYNIYKPHFVVVHVSLLEQADKHLGENKFNSILKDIFKESDIILTTGRGKVTGRYREEYGEAVPISDIIKSLRSLKEFGKFILANVLIGFNRNIFLNEIKEKCRGKDDE